MNTAQRVLMAGATGLALALMGCQGGGIQRVDPEKVTDVSRGFNDTDARQIFQSLSEDCLSRPWIDNWMHGNGGDYPIIFLGEVRNDTEEYIDTDMVTNQIQRVLLNSGRVRIKAVRDARAELREERLDTQFNDPDTIKAVAKEINADFALVGQGLERLVKSVSIPQHARVDANRLRHTPVLHHFVELRCRHANIPRRLDARKAARRERGR